MDVEQEERLHQLIEHLKSFVQHKQSRVIYTAENNDDKVIKRNPCNVLGLAYAARQLRLTRAREQT